MDQDLSTSPAEDGRSNTYLRLLLWLLVPAAFFNTYDSELRAVLLTQLKDSFHVGTAAIGLANIPIGSGQFVAFAIVLLADRIGRRPILLWSIVGYTVFTTLSAAAWGLWSFAFFQSCAQVFIGAEFGVAVTLLAEEAPPERRGRYLSLLLLVSPLGAVLGGLLVAVGFLHNPIGWRAFFLVAAIPLTVASIARRRLHESHAYLVATRRRREETRKPARRVLSAAFGVWQGRQRSRVAAVGVIAFLQGLASAAAIGWWTYYAEHERHLSTGIAGAFFAAAALVSVGGYALCGRLMDRVGRRWTAIAYAFGAVVCALGTFQVANPWIMFPFLIGTAFFGIGVAPALSGFATELFSTEVRAQASAWIRNGFGNTGSVLGPAIVGILGASAGLLHNVGNAVSAVALLSLAIVPIVLWAVPETRKVSLEADEGDRSTRQTEAGEQNGR
jgi:MFS family permease